MQDAFSSLALANLLYLRPWTTKFLVYGAEATWSRRDPAPREYGAQMLAVLLVAAAFYALFRTIRHLQYWSGGLRRAIGMATASALCAIPAGLLTLNNPFGDVRGRYALAAGVISVCAAGVLFATGWRTPLRVLAILLSATSPTMLFTFGKSLVIMTTDDPRSFAAEPSAPRLTPGHAAPHVVWVIFDEWDEELSFQQRPPSVKLPELDRLRAESFYSDSAFTPGPQTVISMPALTIGKRVLGFESDGPDDEKLYLAGATTAVPWRSSPTVFSAARGLGMNTGVVGWYIPYCRVIGSSLTGCENHNDSEYFTDRSFPQLTLNSIRSLAEPGLRSPFGQTLSQKGHAWLFHRLLDASESMLLKQRYNLTLLHLPVPHKPFFYNAATGADDLDAKPSLRLSNGLVGYFDALALVDRTVGRMRRDLEAAGLWEDTTFLLSADHFLRARTKLDGHANSRYVPFIVKLAGQHESVRGETPFNALLTHDLLLAILKREVSTPKDVANWITAHRAQFPLNWNAP